MIPTHCPNCGDGLHEELRAMHADDHMISCSHCKGPHYCFVRVSSQGDEITGWGIRLIHQGRRYYLRSLLSHTWNEPPTPYTNVEYDDSNDNGERDQVGEIIGVEQYFPYPADFTKQECAKILIRLLNLVVFS